ncbi:M42 family metallopeptidase [Rhodohalobacter barkolensis]|uniref:Endoglucanase n=1 Tax=Rhodohalobacter barkolensis TaxID=2053187 RepID=A0A2N0VGY8_9BACT|nr:M42 family metallopeptidase [Rhodohalobacter barkolensis]PKD43459.1 endoglucanase [Rhodohalobacter barkolensis]
MKLNFKLLKEIVSTPGAPGHESPIRSVLINHIRDHVDEYSVDRMGNLIARVKGDGPKVMAAAHMDEISLITTHVDSKGFIRFSTLGGFDPETLITQRVLIHGNETIPGVIGSKPIHIQTDSEKKSKSKLKNLFIDTGLPADRVKELIPNGTPVTRDKDLLELGECISSKSLDNRISVYILIEALQRAKKSNCDFYAAFTVQEEVGIRGARVAAQAIQPEIGLNLDVTLANDLPGVSDHEVCTLLGEGIGIKIMDKSVICTPTLVRHLEDLANKNSIKIQREVLTAGGTDTSAMQYLVGIGSHVTSISCPVRYIHSTAETCAISDVKAGIKLTTLCIENIGSYSFK